MGRAVRQENCQTHAGGLSLSLGHRCQSRSEMQVNLGYKKHRLGETGAEIAGGDGGESNSQTLLCRLLDQLAALGDTARQLKASLPNDVTLDRKRAHKLPEVPELAAGEQR